MDALKAFNTIERFAPCTHEHVDTNLGTGDVWARCQDCDELIEQSHLPAARQAAQDFAVALSSLRKLVGSALTSVSSSDLSSTELAERHAHITQQYAQYTQRHAQFAQLQAYILRQADVIELLLNNETTQP